ncbi:MAG: phage tail protein [Pseudomonadota bacterium]
MLAALGLFVFDITSLPFGELTHKREWKHEAAPRVGARDGSQFVGPGEDSVSLSGALVPGVVGRFAALDTLVDMADRGDTYQFVDGTGRVWGGYVILLLDTRRKHLMIDGVPRWVDFTIDLRRVD